MTSPNLAHPHDYDHRHSVSSSGWLRAAVFGAMDGLVSNVGLVSGVAASGAAPATVLITGVSGLISGAVSMALGEYTSVRVANEQLDTEVQVERDAHSRNPVGEQAELTLLFERLGMSDDIAATAAEQVHENGEQAVLVHLAHELNLNPEEKPSPRVAAGASFASFGVGALIPILPFIFGFGSLVWALVFGALGLFLTGAVAARITRSNWGIGALRQVVFGGIAFAVTYAIGHLLGVSLAG